MITKMLNKNIIDQINDGLISDGLSFAEQVAVSQIKKDRLKELFAYLFESIEKYGYFVHRMVISPQVMCLIRQMDYRDFQFNESTRKELLAIGIVGGLWTADIYTDKECVGIVLYSTEDSEKVTEDHPSLKAKWDAIRKTED